MSASTGDKIVDVRNAARPNSTTVFSPRAAAGNTLSCTLLTGWPIASKVHFVTYQIDSSSNPIAGTQLDCSGIVSGNTITSFSVIDGNDTGNSIGDVVEMLPTAAWAQDLADALTASHNRDGTPKSNITYPASIFTAPTIADFTNADHSHANAAGGGKLNGTNAITANSLFSTVLGLSNALDASNGVQHQVNAGTAGGDIWYINLGGIKLAWCQTVAFATSTSSTNVTITWPVGFFTTMQAVMGTLNGVGSTAQQFFAGNNGTSGAGTTTTYTFYVFTTTGTGTANANVLALGT